MPHSFGYRARTRKMFSRPFRQHGPEHLSTYLTTYRVGDWVDIKANGSIHRGMPHKFYHGKTGMVWNVTKRAVGIELTKTVGTRVIRKKVHVRVEHVSHSRCREDFLNRVKENERLRKEAKAEGSMSAKNTKNIIFSAARYNPLLYPTALCRYVRSSCLGVFMRFAWFSRVFQRRFPSSVCPVSPGKVVLSMPARQPSKLYSKSSTSFWPKYFFPHSELSAFVRNKCAFTSLLLLFPASIYSQCLRFASRSLSS
jgi:large subunit ribosomal protein L21e